MTAPVPGRRRRRRDERARIRGEAVDLVRDLAESELPGFDERLLDDDARTVARSVPRAGARVLQLCWQASPRLTGCLLAAQVVAAALTAGSFLQVTGVLSALFGAGPTPDRVHAALPSLLLAAALVTARAGAGSVVRVLLAKLAPRVTRHSELSIYAAAVHADLITYEDADWYESLARAQDRGLSYVEMAVGQLVALLDSVVGLLAIAAVLATLHPALVLLLALSVGPDAWAARRSAHVGYAGMITYAMLRRRLGVMTQLGTDRNAAGEIRAYGLQRFLIGEHGRLAHAACHEGERIELAQVRAETVGRAISGVAAALNLLALGVLTTRGSVPLAGAGAALLALTTSRSMLRNLLTQVNRLYECGLSVLDVDRFVAATRRRALRETGVVAPVTPAEITVSNVSFTYPGCAEPALHDVSLTVRRGEVVGLVGENGSGKSTLAKVIAGLFEADSGTVLWDDLDLASCDAASVHRGVALVGQESTRWPFTVETNIALGDVDRPRTQGAIAGAARRAGADAMIDRLPAGYDTRLSRLFRGGQDLSGGQWQLLSIARALYRDASLTICDEPTAALDPRAEHELYRAIQRMARSTRRHGDTVATGGGPSQDGGSAVLLISHRLSSVRTADRIYVLDRGRIVEWGTHAELVAAGGLYRDLYAMQASGYRDGELLASVLCEP